jgi:hypothetical protein
MMMTKKLAVLGAMAALFTCAAGAQAVNDAPWVGVWQGWLDGQPGVTLTLAEDTGELGGTVVFNMVSREGGRPHVIGSETHELMHARLEGKTLSLEVKQPKLARTLEVEVKLVADGKITLHCLNCGAGSPVAELVKYTP